jgi:hypothetical protein
MKYLRVTVVVLFGILIIGCQKDVEHDVMYRITKSVSGFDVNYRDGNGVLQSESVETQSAEDVWMRKFDAKEGDIVFVSAVYDDPESSILLQILIDGKVYKEGSSSQDTARYITVSGTVPFR